MATLRATPGAKIPMGALSKFERREMREALDRVLDAWDEHDVVPGIHVVQSDVEEALTRFHGVYRMIATASISRCSREPAAPA